MNPKVWRNEQGSLCCPSEVPKKSRSMKRLKRKNFFINVAHSEDTYDRGEDVFQNVVDVLHLLDPTYHLFYRTVPKSRCQFYILCH